MSLSKKVQEALKEFENDSLQVTFCIGTLVGLAIILFTSISYGVGDGERWTPVGIMIYIEYFLYLYPVGFITLSYVALQQFKLKEAEIVDFRDSDRVKIEEDKYIFLLWCACIPYINALIGIPIALIIPAWVIGEKSFNGVSKVTLYIFKKYKTALEKIANQNQKS